jgi:hypothetical protein
MEAGKSPGDAGRQTASSRKVAVKQVGAWENNIDKLLSVLSRNAQVV